MWNTFWFKPMPATSIALFRICFASIILILELVQLLPDFDFYYGKCAPISNALMATEMWQRKPILDLFLLSPDNLIWYQIIFSVTVIATISLLFGFRTRLSACLTWLGLVSMHTQFPWIDNGGDGFIRIALFWLMFSNAGDSISLDRFLKARKSEAPERSAPQWAQRVLQICLSFTYLYAVSSKLHGSMWITGNAFYYCIRLKDFYHLPLPAFVEGMFASHVLSYFTLIAETAMFTLVWFPPLRYLALFLGACLHLGIDWSMNLGLFEWVFLSAYVLFIPPSDWHHLAQRVKQFYCYCQRKSISSP
jgi:Vitamin K-dependent gamma-carboxylase